ncbi:hypothetical protein niasHS_004954 [Heterodera schachtii]|uniref:MATH domain-containing protein n=1 Tax=Heterodera schachtii TaxID=97005 RepID=A0ABD2K142_HETSC
MAFQEARFLNVEVFARRCLRYIDQNAIKLIKSEAFLQIGQAFLCEILRRDQLRISEIEIWNSALRWADEQCRQNVSTGVLTTEERFGVFQHYFDRKLSDAPGLFPSKFPTHRRHKNGETIEMEIKKVSKFVLEAVESYRLSDAVDIWGFSLRITAEITKKNAEKYGFYHKDEDKVKLAIEVIINVPKTENLAFDAYKSTGTLSMEIEKVSEFAREIKESDRTSETVYITGMPWKIVAKIRMKNESTEKWLGFFLFCDASEEDGNWSRECSMTFRIVSQKSDVMDKK